MQLARPVSLAISLSVLACHTLRPVELDELRPGMEVQARISASQAEELAEYLPNETDRLIQGTVLDTAPGQLFLMVPITTRSVPGQRETLSQRLEIPAEGIFEIEQRELDRWRTGLLAGAGALLTGYVLYETLGEGSSGSSPGPGGPGPEDSVIIFSIPIGW
mgnify:CR=1 FL=1|jgi:hypothetical protein